MRPADPSRGSRFACCWIRCILWRVRPPTSNAEPGREVSCRALVTLVAAFDARGVELATLTAGTSLSVATLRDRNQRIAWSELCVILRNAATVLSREELQRVGERFVAPGDTVERMMYGWSVVHCLPVSMVEQLSEAIGTAIRPEIVQRCARDAGFARCEVLTIDSPLFRFYRLRA